MEHTLRAAEPTVTAGDRVAESILWRAPDAIDPAFLEALTDADRLALRAFGTRMATVALREGSVHRLRTGLLAAGLAIGDREDRRDVLVRLAVHFAVAEALGVPPASVFSAVADRLPAGPAADLLRRFGTRRDVTLSAYGWCQVDTADGPEFHPVP